MSWHVYIISTENNQLYTGITNNLERRFKEHKSGRGARFTRIFGVNKLLYQEEFPNRSLAMQREAEIKRWPREKKLALISS